MSFILGAKAQASQQSAVSGLQLQSSTYGKCVPIVYGTTRIAPNLIWYGDFVATPQASSAGLGGGKGGVGGGGGGKGGGGSTSYTYQTAVALGLCEGPIQGVGSIYADKNITTSAALGLTFFAGDYGQSPWGYLQSNHPDMAIGYSGISYLASNAYQLGTSPQLPNHNVEVAGIFSDSLSSIGVEDADPSLVLADLLTNAHYGIGFPASRLGDLSVYQSYCLATGLWISPAYTEQVQASSMLDDIATGTNSAYVWSSGVLTLVPYGDQAISANGYSYTPPSSALYDLGDDDFLPNTNAVGSSATMNDDPVLLTRTRQSDALDSIVMECVDRTNSYNSAIVEAQAQAAIETYGLRQSQSTQMDMFADLNAARISAQLQLQRQFIRNTYQFTLDQRYVLLDPMDIVTLTDANLGLNKQWVRITEITENDDSTLSISAEEYLNGTGNAPAYNFQQGLGFSVNYNSASGNANPPVIFEPTAELAEDLEVWFAISGGTNWGGCDIWTSTDGNSYKNMGRITGSARTGVLSDALPAIAGTSIGQSIDVADILSVDLSQSNGQLLSGTQSDATSLSTLCYVDGEYIAYQNATLTGNSLYNLSYLIRGAYDSPIGAHVAGSPFARLDGGIFKIPFTQDLIGTLLYIKLVSFNVYGSGQQLISEVEPYTYTLKGTAFSSPLPDITHLTTSYVASNTQLSWDEVVDFRPVLYEIRKGAGWAGAQVLGRVAHPPFSVQGDGTYFVCAYSQPVAGLQVYSINPQEVIVSGSQIVSNVVVSWDEAATGWSGTFSGTAALSGGYVCTSGSGNILSDSDFINTPDLFNYGAEGNGIYEIPVAHRVNIGRIEPCNVLISWSSIGQKITDNILTVGDYMNYQDILDFAASANTNIYPEIALSPDGSSWGAWQKYTSGAYNAMAFKARMQLQTSNASVQSILQSFLFSVDVPDRDDHYVNLSIPTSGLALIFTPDGATTPAAFNGGPQGSPSAPAIQVTILNAQAGDIASITAVTLSGCTIQILNGGAGVARNVNILAEGY